MTGSEVTFLLVEDDPIDAMMFRRVLDKSEVDAEFHHCTDGAAALDTLRALGAKNIVVFLDLNMPGVNGHDFLDELRADPALKRVIVFVLTSSEHQRDVELAYDKNVAGYFNKDNISKVLEIAVPYVSHVCFPSVGS